MNHQAAFTQFFFDLEDPRQATKIAYPFFDVVFLTVCAAIGGAHGWEDIELFGEAHLEWLQRNGLFLKGLPVHDTIARIISRIQPEQFQNAFVRWMQATSERTDGELIAIDGKTLRSSYDRDSRQSTIHMVSAFAAHNRLVLSQVKTDAKSNEITAIPELLAILDVKGCLVSIDAMGCQTAIASNIIKGGGDYLLAVKGNQPTLHHAVQAALDESTKKPLSEETLSVEKKHGRIDGREYHVLPAGALIAQFPEWEALKSIGVAISYRIENKKKFSMEYRYYISSAALTSEQFASAVRGHWAIENSLHWVLDVVMNEDACQIYRGDAPQILACARHMAQNMLRAETSRKASLRKKQQFAGMSSPYLEKVLDAGLAELKSI